jgi:hypothetical protein
MMKHFFLALPVIFAVSAFASVTVSSPSNDATVGSPVHFVASATSNCSKGVASTGIYIDYALAYVVNGTSLNTNLSLSSGTHHITVEEWDNCGGATTAKMTITVSSDSGVHISSPSNGSQVTSPVQFSATATTSCSKGVASMGIYPAVNQKAYVTSGDSLNTSLSLSSGTYNAVVEEWDKCGGASTAPVKITVSSGKTFSNLQNNSGWIGYGELPSKYDICSSCSPAVTWGLSRAISSPSLSGSAARFSLGGTTPYADALWVNHVMGDGTTQNLPDSAHTLIPSLHNFTYDVYFYGTNLAASEAIEFDLGQYFDGMGFLWGTECRMVSGQEWAIWDNVNGKWVSTSAPCKPASNSWNHLILKFQRTSDNELVYQSVTLNGTTTTLNKTYSPTSTPGWFGVVVNFQLDGNYKQTDYSMYVDKMNIGYN